ncbi:MAG: hypothetical protein ETSY1_30890 [Candidatus Entotheonella factor]|uniref:Uncharacterized protein n=1 Tax=Entotheonella factor TaxID=1429438 RepID=W4LBD1_ENTF1|nr:MAG: hypothetical protein ETSY1_30890 [Candidatus Entotheonella factor]
MGGIVVRECDGCNGLWVPGEYFDELVRRMIEARRKQGPLFTDGTHKKTAFQSKIVYRKCPECQLGMHRKNFARKSGIIVDWCGNHGTWLDADELESIAAFVLAGKLENQTSNVPMQSWQQPANAKRMEVIYQTEALMAAERKRLEQQRTGNQSDIDANMSEGLSLTGLIRWLLN